MFKVGQKVRVKTNSNKRSTASRLYAGQIGTITSYRAIEGIGSLDIENSKYSGGFWAHDEWELVPTIKLRRKHLQTKTT